MGGRFDYEFWPERDRFKELDRAISVMSETGPDDAEEYALESVDEVMGDEVPSSAETSAAWDGDDEETPWEPRLSMFD